MNDTFIAAIASNGPWAITSFILMHQVIKAWSNDRQQLITLLTEFKDTLTVLTHAVEKLNNN